MGRSWCYRSTRRRLKIFLSGLLLPECARDHDLPQRPRTSGSKASYLSLHWISRSHDHVTVNNFDFSTLTSNFHLTRSKR